MEEHDIITFNGSNGHTCTGVIVSHGKTGLINVCYDRSEWQEPRIVAIRPTERTEITEVEDVPPMEREEL